MALSDGHLSGDLEHGISLGVVILAAGRGVRVGDAPCPKQYCCIAGEAMLSRVARAFRSWNSNCAMVIVHNANDIVLLQDALHWRDENMHNTTGGPTRQASTLRGLQFLASSSVPPSQVFIHDAARPFVSPLLLDRLQACLMKEPQTGVKEMALSGTIVRTVPRDRLYRSQTPQGFPLKAILEVHERLAKLEVSGLTDNASVFEWAGFPVRIAEGESRNVKITYPSDFIEAERNLGTNGGDSIPDVRVGHGYDAHKLTAGGRMVLCGVEILHDSSLKGHSDADAGLHALTDAILATIGAGDIGTHFPSTDPRWEGESSSIFLQYANRLVKEAGGIIRHCDVTLICEAPKISAYREAMEDFVAAALGLDRGRVSIKATTNEQMGFVGREEGIAAFANATAVFR